MQNSQQLRSRQRKTYERFEKVQPWNERSSRLPSSVEKGGLQMPKENENRVVLKKKYSLMESQFIDSIRRAHGLSPKQYNYQDDNNLVERNNNSYSLKRDAHSKYMEGNYRMKTPKNIDFEEKKKKMKKKLLQQRRNASKNISLPRLHQGHSARKILVQKQHKLGRYASPKDKIINFYRSKAEDRLEIQRKIFRIKQKL